MRAKPKVSVVIVAFDMAREIPRTVTSFLPPYQIGVADDQVEVLVLENGSNTPIPAHVRDTFPESVRVIDVPDPKPSPAHALNYGVQLARADWVCLVIDGARMASPGIVGLAIRAFDLDPSPVIATLGWHLGPKPQAISVAEGYDQTEEDRLLSSIRWPEDGYRLFDIASLGLSARSGWFGPIAESNAVFIQKSHYDRIGGFDPRFDLPGGGIANHDFFRRCVEDPELCYVLLLGEGTFHQHHGGVTTSKGVDDAKAPSELSTWEKYAAQYQSITGRPYAVPSATPILFGRMTPPATRALSRCLTSAHEIGADR